MTRLTSRATSKSKSTLIFDIFETLLLYNNIIFFYLFAFLVHFNNSTLWLQLNCLIVHYKIHMAYIYSTTICHVTAENISPISRVLSKETNYIFIYIFQHSAKSLFDLWLFLLIRWPYTSQDTTAKPATSAGENRSATTPGTSSPTLLE